MGGELAKAVGLAWEEDGCLSALAFEGALLEGADLSGMEWKEVRLAGCRFVPKLAR